MNNCSGCFLSPPPICLSLFPELPTPGPAKSQTWPWPSASRIWHRRKVLPAPRRKGPGGGRTGWGGSHASAWAKCPVQAARAPGELRHTETAIRVCLAHATGPSELKQLTCKVLHRPLASCDSRSGPGSRLGEAARRMEDALPRCGDPLIFRGFLVPPLLCPQAAGASTSMG